MSSGSERQRMNRKVNPKSLGTASEGRTCARRSVGSPTRTPAFPLGVKMTEDGNIAALGNGRELTMREAEAS